MYKKYLVVAGRHDTAGMNIALQLSQFKRVDIYLIDGEVIYNENLDLKRLEGYDFIIFASKHESKEARKTISIHAPGNFLDNRFGGEKEKLCKTSALFLKHLFACLKIHCKDLEEYQLTLECTHHGPLINLPCVFVEIGSTPNEWNDKRACFSIAKGVLNAIDTFKENPYNEVAVGIGGPHYCPVFNKLQDSSNVAFSHIIPQYVLPLTDNMITQAIENTDEEVDFVVLDWKGLGNSEQRKQVIEVLDRNYVSWKKISDVKR
jgi:D-tyrosyl-tRNA(Tyr) deacylase